MISYKPGFHNFLFPGEIQDPFLTLSHMGIEQRNSPDYNYNNSDRTIDSYLFQYTLRGSGIYEDSSGTYTLTPGHAFFIRLPSASSYYIPDKKMYPSWDFLFLMMKGEHVRKYHDMITSHSGNVLELSLKARPVQTLLDIYNQAQTGQIVHPFHASELAYRFLCQLCQSQFHSEADYSRRTQTAIHLMEQHYAELDSIEELAGLLHLTNSHFTREFRKETGITPIRYLTTLRLSQAARLLHESTLPISEVALSCGFSSGNYFSRLFRQHVHMSPLEYRSEWQ